MKQGEADFTAADARRDAGEENIELTVYAEFYQALIEAEMEAEIMALAVIRKTGTQKDPRHLQWWLERKFPSRWGRRFIQKEISGPGGGPISVQDLSPISDEERAARIRKLMAGATA